MRLKNLLYCLSALMLLASCRGNEHHAETDARPEFKMILRLWPDHHNDTVLRDQLLQALRKYPQTFEEVWFCMEFETLSMDAHSRSARAMAEACRKMREIGVIPSIQGITLGHGDNFESGSEALVPTGWGTMADAAGITGRTSHCPRQQAFLDYLGTVYATYAERCQPSTVWLDDDLRVTYHTPVRQSCFCDTCIEAFNREYGGRWNRETLATALENNEGEGTLRRQWIAFCQQSLAGVARTISRSVHNVSPSTQMGLQHTNFHRELLEGRDWNPSFDAMEQETGLAPASRPGNGFYNDHAPREMIAKGYDMARQIRRLNPDISEIAAEVEGYRHVATGKSPHGLCVESLFYLAMGATQLSYAIICAASEPMEWYADNYFKSLSAWRPLYKEYVQFNRGTEPGGIDPYISPRHVARDSREGEPFFGWATTGAGDMAHRMAPLGIPFCPDGNNAAALMMDAQAVEGLASDEAARLFQSRGIMLDEMAWSCVRRRQIDTLLTPVPLPEGLTGAACYASQQGGRVAVIPSFGASVSNAQRLNLILTLDWLAGNTLPVITESMAQAVVVPRVDSGNRLRSVTVLNCSISEQPGIRLRLRGCDTEGKQSFVWKRAGKSDINLRPRYDLTDVIIEIPALEGWNTGWLAIK